ncbi:MAG: B12-binding domain-containing radical SAM protein [Bacteroidetes bacterium]|nr:B12-binding domain-containing radical SAM protein [Bacteroidota bacterium]
MALTRLHLSKKLRIGLINPNRNLKDAAIHLGLGYLASYARQHHLDLEFKLLDTRIAHRKDFENFFSQAYDLFAFTASSQVFDEAIEMAEKLKQSYPETPICIGGSHASTEKERCLSGYPFDFAIYGEGEQTFSELIAYFKGEKELESIHGLIYKNESEKIYINTPRSLILNIDEIPFPAYDLFEMKKYHQHRLTTSRGCPYNCVFCNSSSLWTHKWRKRSPENIFAEIRFLIKHFGRKTIIFNDDSFNIDAKRVIEFCNLLIEKKLGIIWSTSIRVDLVTQEVADLMFKSGCYNVSVGIESANDEVLKRMNKNTTREKIYAGIQMLRKAGIDVMGQFMIGNPGDTLESVKESIEFARTSNLTGVEFYTALPYRDSLLWEFVEEHGKLLTDVEPYRYHNFRPRIIFETPEFPFDDRLKAIELAGKNGFYHALTHDEKNVLLDSGRIMAQSIQKIIKGKSGNKLYLGLRKVYRNFK